MRSCSDTGIHLTIQLSIRTTQNFPQICVVVQSELLHFTSIIKLLQQPSPGMNNTICSLFFHLNYEDYQKFQYNFVYEAADSVTGREGECAEKTHMQEPVSMLNRWQDATVNHLTPKND